MTRIRLLVLGNGAAGAEKQALGLSARLQKHLARAGVCAMDPVDVVRVPLKPSTIFQKLPPALQLLGTRAIQDPFFGYDATPDQKQLLLGKGSSTDANKRVVIGCGRSTVALCAGLKQPWAGPSSDLFNIQIQHPRVPLELFDAVITPRHDVVGKNAAANVHLTYGTVCSIDDDHLQREGDQWRDVLGAVSTKRERIAWLVGGPCRGFAFSENDTHAMVDQILRVAKQFYPTAALLVTFSRRTPTQVQASIRDRLTHELSESDLYLWDGSGSNPFYAMLHFATAIATTPDSISMTTEAIATGKPVLTVCADRVSGKFRHFHDMLSREGFTIAVSDDVDSVMVEPSPHGRGAIETELETIAATLTARILQH